MGECIQKTQKCQSVMHRNTTYRDTCLGADNGFCEGSWQAHHITCHHAVAGRDIEDENLHYVEDCLWVTPWDLNAADNLIGLPVNSQFRKSNGLIPPGGYCSHQVDHNTAAGYTDECKQWLQQKLWNTLKSQKKKHEWTPKSVKSTLVKCTNSFKRRLAGRANRKGGTLLCWQSRFKPKYEYTWYYPFSMAAKPNYRGAGVDTDKWKKMTGVFELIK